MEVRALPIPGSELLNRMKQATVRSFYFTGRKLKDVTALKARNLQPREPMSTVNVFHSTAMPMASAIKYMKQFGELEKVIQTGSRSLRITYRFVTLFASIRL